MISLPGAARELTSFGDASGDVDWLPDFARWGRRCRKGRRRACLSNHQVRTLENSMHRIAFKLAASEELPSPKSDSGEVLSRLLWKTESGNSPLRIFTVAFLPGGSIHGSWVKVLDLLSNEGSKPHSIL